MDGQWDIIVSSLQKLCASHEALPLDGDGGTKRVQLRNMTAEQLQLQLLHYQEHRDAVGGARRLVAAMQAAVDALLGDGGPAPPDPGPAGRSYWTSSFNPNDPIYVGSEVAYKPRRTGAEGEWFQCQVIKVSADGTRFEVRDPEPDEFGQPGGTFKCNWKELLLIPPRTTPRQLTPHYPSGTKVLARYPETTTFYPAMVIGNKRDGTCRLRFDGEEEADKETEVDRRYVLPFPARRS
ncbi:AAL019Wp [Eremothecium gossypii ATCC 10895]|uniref:AAL019Wp n=1 Tax=Eremothecium gossypii (strain ATCC 10895 / CBS 109.51 / FGSC 9923 / NRRL Y-1056) TaxID=284811 RepID=Q75EU8_EREGS|nr:AAL019Wp [Eremothecium gossypii ATCC 10895]AAS50347.1 AAL019Wp [Eremothecium gossypii ATCC 10895]AEY94633.1 FAAL019Wp [Eremothecium gossypii FDAG1]